MTNCSSTSPSSSSKNSENQKDNILGKFLVRKNNKKQLALQITNIEVYKKGERPTTKGIYVTPEGNLALAPRYEKINILITGAGHINSPERILLRLDLLEKLENDTLIDKSILWIEPRI